MPRRRTRQLQDASSTRLPVWARDIITVVGTLVAVVGVVLTLIQVFADDEVEPVGPQASIEEVRFEPNEVVANGGFRLVDLASEVILFVRKHDEAGEERWVPIGASASPDDQVEDGRVNGRWNAIFPVNEEGQFSWQVLIVEAAGLAASGGYDDLRRLGPDSELVVAASDVFSVEDDDADRAGASGS